MKNLFKNASVNLFLITFPALLAMACTHVLAAVAILATLLTVEIMAIEYRRDYWKRKTVRARGIYSFLGVALGLSVLTISLPPRLAITIALCLLLIGTVQLALEEPFHSKKMLWLKIWEGRNGTEQFAFVEHIFFLAIALFFVLMVVANFSSQAIWLPLTACGLIVFALVKGDIFYFSDDLAVKVFSFIALAITGIVSTLIQFNEARIFGILIWVIVLIIGIILILAVIAIYFRAVIKEKRRTELENAAAKELQVAEQKKKEMLQRSLLERTSELTWEEIFIGFNQINEALGIQLFLSHPNLGELSELVTVSNEKGQIFWNNDLSRMLQIMEKATSKTQDDENLRKILNACDSIENATVTKKSKKTITYKGETELQTRLDTIRKMIKS